VKVFVTGATGVIGRRVVPRLIALNHSVSVMVRARHTVRTVEHVGAQPIEANLFDPEGLRRALAGQDVVVNLATHMPPSTFRMLLRAAWRENDRIRSEGSANLVTAAMVSGVQRFIQESFAPVYPDCGDRWIEEDTPISPVSYNRTIGDAERSAERFTAHGGAGIVLRFGQFYGADARQTRDMIALVRRGWAPMPGPPDAFLSSVIHDDAAAAVVHAIEAPAGAYNVVDDEPVTHREFFDVLAAALHVHSPSLPPLWLTPLFGSAGEMLARSTRISNASLKRETSWRPMCASVRQGWAAVVRELDAVA
jgi:nucleoside-diphosphate-sugar epimerase